MKALDQPVKALPYYDELVKRLINDEGIIRISGCIESQKANLEAALTPEGYSALVIAENELAAKEACEDFRLYDRNAYLYPARDMIFYQADVSGNLITRQRLSVIRALCEQKKVTVVTSAGGVLDVLLRISVLKDRRILIRTGSELDIPSLSKDLTDLGYERCARVEAGGQFAVRGGIVDIFDLTEELPFRIELFGDEVDSVRRFEPESQRSVENIQEAVIYPASEAAISETEGSTFIDYFPENTIIFINEPRRVLENAKAIIAEYAEAMHRRAELGRESGLENAGMTGTEELLALLQKKHCAAVCMLDSRDDGFEIKRSYHVEARSVQSYQNSFEMLIKDLKKRKKAGCRTVLLTGSGTRGRRLAADLMDEGLSAFYSETDERELQPSEICVLRGTARKGFEYPLANFALLTEGDIFGTEKKKKNRHKKYNGSSITGFGELSIGDTVVHEKHGLGIYRGIEQIERDGAARDYIKLEYAGGDVLYILATQLDTLQKYGSSPEHKHLKLNKLGGSEWKRTKSRVRKAVQDMANELVELYAKRDTGSGYAFGEDTVWQREFEELFPFEETEDQLDAIEAAKKDMESTKIMDRLICGDVGYGKTEIALRAAFKAVQDSKQVAMLVPTTILAQQHYNTFLQRMGDFPVRVDMLSRFRTAGEQKKTISDLKNGMVDIVIGTHRLLSKDIEFKDLGLLVVDEEQRFGVSHKEKIKQMRSRVDVLTLTATPIPRTLHMGLIGIRDVSVLDEPPLDRMPVQTYIMEYDDEIVREAITRELARDGQVYFVTSRIAGIIELTNRISELVPDANVAFAHGRMREHELEDVMYRFINHEIDVLVSTTIIETGMDIPNVNTLIVRDSDRFGLSQLYQIRGRVGRTNRTAYAFLMYRKNKMLTEQSEKRLHAIREFTEPGSGIRIAMRDLEIRGAGNLLGAEQSGHMDAVGYDLYCKMLSEAVREAKGFEAEEDFETTLDIPADAFIPDTFIPDEKQKLDVYKRIAAVSDIPGREDIIEYITDLYGDIPKSVLRLIDIALLKARAHRLFMTNVKQTFEGLRFDFYENAGIRTENLPELMTKYKGFINIYMVPAPHLVLRQEKNSRGSDVLKALDTFFTDCESLLV